MSGSNQTGVRESPLVTMLFAAQNSLCFICDEPMIRGESALRYGRMGWTREHVYPRSGCGYGLSNNIVLSHPVCNGNRANREPTPEEIQKARHIYAKIGIRPFLRDDERHQRYDGLLGKGNFSGVVRSARGWSPMLEDLVGVEIAGQMRRLRYISTSI